MARTRGRASALLVGCALCVCCAALFPLTARAAAVDTRARARPVVAPLPAGRAASTQTVSSSPSFGGSATPRPPVAALGGGSSSRLAPRDTSAAVDRLLQLLPFAGLLLLVGLARASLRRDG
jgi:hypothetical protein